MSSAGVHGDQDSFDASLSADGHFVAFASFSTNLVTSSDTNLASDVFVHSRTGTTAPYSFCFGDFAAADCPCGNFGATGRGCENSAGLGGALLTVAGTASISSDTVVFTSSFELATATSIVLQGNASIPPQAYGDGARCAGGSLLRLYVKSAAGGVVTAPQGSDPSVSARSAALGDTLTIGATRYYQVDYRDPSTVFCPAPPGGLQNISNAIAVVWDP